MTPRATVRANQITGLATAIAEIRPLPQPADTLLHQFFRQHKAMGQHDRAFIADGVFAYLRRRRSLEAIAQTQSPRHLALAVLVRELGIGVRECEGALSADDALWLRAFKSRVATPLLPAVAADLPDWLWERLGDGLQRAPPAEVREDAVGHERPVVLAHRLVLPEELVQQRVGGRGQPREVADRRRQRRDVVRAQRHCSATGSSTRIESSSASRVPRWVATTRIFTGT